MRRELWGVVLAVALLAPGVSRAAAPERAVFALIVGVNRSVDADLPRLRYADDDAARYFELFRMLGAKSYLLARFDEGTRRVHVQAAAEARLPRAAVLHRTVKDLRVDVARARSRGLPTLLYVIYAGHGKVGDGEGYISLEDERLTGEALARRVLAAVGADASHILVDACNSYLLAFGRGPGGKRRPVRGFSRMAGTLSAPNVGLLLSTSSARESHEWEGFQAGVFSHAVRSGLLGAADADGDRRVSYREIAAFVEQAYRSIPNERFRSRVFTRTLASTGVLLDLRRGRPAIRIDGPRHGRFLLEDTRGVRLADFHSSPKQTVRLLRPPGKLVYLRHVGEEREYAIQPNEGTVELASLDPERPRAAVRGAASHAFARLFELSFDRDVVARYAPPEIDVASAPERPRRSWRGIAAWSTLAVSVAALAAGGALTASALDLQSAAPQDEPQVDRLDRNASIRARNRAAVGLYAAGGAAAAASLLLFVWPAVWPGADRSPVAGVFDGTGVQVSLRGRF